jgi:uncharacterized protein (DUF433 family)
MAQPSLVDAIYRPPLPYCVTLKSKRDNALDRASQRDERAGHSTAVQRTDGVSGGAACVGNSRIPVWTLVQLKKLGRNESDLVRDFPGLTREDLDAVWNYYRQNPAEIDAEIAGQDSE